MRKKKIKITPKNESGLTQMILMRKSIRQIWVNFGLETLIDGVDGTNLQDKMYDHNKTHTNSTQVLQQEK